MSAFAIASAVGVGLTTGTAAVVRGRRVARVLAVMLSLHTLSSAGVYALLQTPALHVGFWVLQALTLLYVATMLWPRLRPVPFQVAVAWPAATFIAGTFLALPWAMSALTPWSLPWPWLPYLFATVGLLQSVTARRETVTLNLRQPPLPTMKLQRDPHMVRRRRGLQPRPDDRPLRIAHITDPHLGPFMSEAALARICTRAVAADPDLILLTGDYLTIMSQDGPEHLTRALAPLATHPRVFASSGNHDHETPEWIDEALRAAGVVVLDDAAQVVHTPQGAVELVGVNFRWRDRERVTDTLLNRARPTDESGQPMPRIVLMHDPGMFRYCPPCSADLVLSGHTHGGHVGLVSLGLDWTVVNAVTGLPDHSGWTHKGNRLYVHRGNGHYGFPLRLGVPAEESVLDVVLR